ncbi:MAG: AAA family ATPase [Actinomycetia bacterium]|nr:AAA family ATPase [Actinomycetes bacterium]
MLDEIKIDDGGFYQGWSCGGLIKKRTVIFGRNGSGKTTLVRHLRDEHHSEFTSAAAVTANTDLDVLVFNDDYVRENLGRVFTGSGLSSALFVTGSLNVEIEAEIDAATQRRDRVTGLVTQASRIFRHRGLVLKTAEDNARDAVRALPGESGAMTGATAIGRLRQANPCSDGDDVKDRRLLTTDQGSIPDSVAGLPDALVSFDPSHIEGLLSRNVASDASIALSGMTPVQRSWVEKGAELHKDRDTCLLCENDLVPPRSDLLAALRTTEMLGLRADLDAMSTGFQQQTDTIRVLIDDLVEMVKPRFTV